MAFLRAQRQRSCEAIIARLTTPSPRLGAAPPRLAAPTRQDAERERLARRDRDAAWRAWYKTARWQGLRAYVLQRDHWTCQQTGALLTGKYPSPDSPVVDHIIPHRGDPALFWNPDNLQAVAKHWHDSVKQARERASDQPSYRPEWLKPSAIPLTIVCGPPAAGKNRYVSMHMGAHDLVIDLDRCAQDVSGLSGHDWDRGLWLNAALFRRNDLLGELSRPGKWPAAWFILTEPEPMRRQWWRDKLRPRQIIVMETPPDRCIANARLDADRDIDRTAAVISRWWSQYARAPGEMVVREA